MQVLYTHTWHSKKGEPCLHYASTHDTCAHKCKVYSVACAWGLGSRCGMCVACHTNDKTSDSHDKGLCIMCLLGSMGKLYFFSKFPLCGKWEGVVVLVSKVNKPSINLIKTLNAVEYI